MLETRASLCLGLGQQPALRANVRAHRACLQPPLTATPHCSGQRSQLAACGGLAACRRLPTPQLRRQTGYPPGRAQLDKLPHKRTFSLGGAWPAAVVRLAALRLFQASHSADIATIIRVTM